MGLTEEEVLISRNKNGSNELTKLKKNTFLKLLIEAMADPIIKILLLALLIKTIFLFRSFDWFETIGILVAVLLATFISSISEYGSESAFSKLLSSTSNITVKVYRNNLLKEISINEIVVGDIIILETGDKIPADGKLISGNLSVDESSLNGETKEVKKSIIKDKNIYRGCTVYNGNAKVKITSVGDNTVYGNISKELQENVPDSPLKLRLRGLAKTISKIGYIGAFLASFAYLFMNIVVNNNFDITLILNTITNFNEMFEYLLYALTLSVTIIVVAVPEGLPMMITLVLSSNMKMMLKDNVLVRKLVGVETAGSLNLLLTDKTGTLTEGKLSVNSFISYDGVEVNSFKVLKKYEKFFKHVYYNLYYNNESVLTCDKIIGGNSTDKALLEFVSEKYFDAKVISKKPFTSNLKYSQVVINDLIDKHYIKGAPEIIIEKCTYYMDKNGNIKKILNKNSINYKLKELTNKGLRVIALAYQKDDTYIYQGLIAIKDKLRKESKNSINEIKRAGIDVIMITGDSLETAKVIAKECDVIDCKSNIVLDSYQFNKLSDEEVMQNLNNIKVIARAMPSDKSRLVKIAQTKNLIVGMTGDGVNDAPALKKANVGFAMGSGTEVAKEASEIVILDNNINSISKAILYGRTIFKSIRKFIIYQLSINVCALFISIVGSFLGISEPITIIQMLWLNMIMDTFAGLAFSFEAPLPEYMEEKPKNKDEPILNKYMLSQILVSGLYTSVICLLFLKLPFIKDIFRTGDDNMYLYTAYFALFIFIGVFNAFNARTTRINIFAGLFKNKVFLLIFAFILITQIYIIYFGGELFRTFGLTQKELIILIIISLSIIPIDIIRKLLLREKGYKLSV